MLWRMVKTLYPLPLVLLPLGDQVTDGVGLPVALQFTLSFSKYPLCLGLIFTTFGAYVMGVNEQRSMKKSNRYV